jgi:hypothetical protein
MAGQKIGKEELKKLLTKAQGDPAFRDKLMRSAKDTLTNEGLNPEQVWVDFFQGLNANNFVDEMNEAIRVTPSEAAT